MSSRVDSCAITWSNLTCRLKSGFRSKEEIILNHLYGSSDFGAITALMGPSGAGKTTLLKCLNGQYKSGLSSSTIIMANKNADIIPCFVYQNSKQHLILTLTAKENISYASKFKNSGEIGFNHEINVNNILRELNLEDVSDTIVGKCSGGQQKRLTIAIEMTPKVKPNVLFIDEPTSGLDSNIAEMKTAMNIKLY